MCELSQHSFKTSPYPSGTAATSEVPCICPSLPHTIWSCHCTHGACRETGHPNESSQLWTRISNGSEWSRTKSVSEPMGARNRNSTWRAEKGIYRHIWMKSPWKMEIVLKTAGPTYASTRNLDLPSSVLASFPAGTLHMVAEMAATKSWSFWPTGLETLAEHVLFPVVLANGLSLSDLDHMPIPVPAPFLCLLLGPEGGADHPRHKDWEWERACSKVRKGERTYICTYVTLQ